MCECGLPIWIKKTGECQRCYHRRYSREHYTPPVARIAQVRRTDCGYDAAHERVRTWRGKASTHICPCAQPAEEWSYRGGSARDLVAERRGRVVHWSPLIEDYDALCIPCHRRRDGGLFEVGNTPSNKRASQDR